MLEKPGDLAAMLTNLKEREVLFIDEIHRMPPTIEEMLYPAMEDYQLDIMIGQGPGARSVQGAAAAVHADRRDDARRAADLAAALALRHRPPPGFLHGGRPPGDRAAARRASSASPIDDDAADEIARRSRGTPRIANRLLRRVRDFAQVRADGAHHARRSRSAALALLEVDEHGFDEIDRRLLRTIIEKFGGGPVGLNSLSAAISEEKDAIEDIYEPFLIQIGFIDRTPRGRVATPRAYDYFGLTAPGKDSKLW